MSAKRYLHRFYSFLLQGLFSPKKITPQVERILIIRLKHLGDFLLTIPAIEAIHQAFPNASIGIVTGEWNRALVEMHLPIDQVFYYNIPKFTRKIEHQQSIQERNKILKNISAWMTDAIYDFDSDLSFFKCISKSRYYYSADALRFKKNLQQLGLPFSGLTYDIHEQYESVNIGNVLKSSGVHNHEFNPKEFFKLNDKEAVVGIHPFASSKEKMFNPDEIAKLADEIYQHSQFPIAFFGASDESVQVESIIKMMKNDARNYSGISMHEFFSYVSNSKAFIGMDSFAQHVAGMFADRYLILYRHKNYKRWARAEQNALYISDESSLQSQLSTIIERLFVE